MTDVHCHLSHFPIADRRDEVIRQARMAGVDTIIDCITDPGLWEKEAAKKEPGIYVSVGIHPQSVREKDFSPEMLALEHLSKNMKVAAIGEAGFDTLKNSVGINLQKKILYSQAEIAVSAGLPIIIHCCGQYDLLLKELKNLRLNIPVILHRYSGGDGQVGAFAAIGCFFSVSGNVLHPNNKKLFNSVRKMPDELILAETDAPYFFPDKRKKSGTPAHLPLVVEKISAIKGKDFFSMNAEIHENTRRAFRERVSFPL